MADGAIDYSRFINNAAAPPKNANTPHSAENHPGSSEGSPLPSSSQPSSQPTVTITTPATAAAGTAAAGTAPNGETDVLSAPTPARERFVFLRGVQWSAPDLNTVSYEHLSKTMLIYPLSCVALLRLPAEIASIHSWTLSTRCRQCCVCSSIV